MDLIGADHNIMNLLRDLRPFLSRRAVAATELAENCLELLAGDAGQKALQSFARLFSRGELMEANGRRFANPFALFLILILLIFSFSGMTSAKIIPVEGEVREEDDNGPV